jgi:hypothetical protein
MSQNYQMPRKYNYPRKYHGYCENCGKKVPQDQIFQYLDGNNIAITYNSQYLCKECYEAKYDK